MIRIVSECNIYIVVNESTASARKSMCLYAYPSLPRAGALLEAIVQATSQWMPQSDLLQPVAVETLDMKGIHNAMAIYGKSEYTCTLPGIPKMDCKNP